ncbi:tetratricopeptide repeat protein [Kiloniella antarctica]|uniref:Tetratricopeptide repeat protein n=1 Tax=Kiloniella antarctica TaxID=1550907 RepID=A0ABW5BRB6_9PROT
MLFKKSITAAIFIGLLPFYSLHAQANGIEYARAAQEAQDFGNRELAIKYYTNALDEGDLSAKHQAYVYNNMGILYQELGNTEDAESHFKNSVQLLPTYSDAYFNLSSLHSSQQRYEDALGLLNAALIELPEDAELILQRGIIYRELNEIEAALQDVSQAVLINPSLGAKLINQDNVYIDNYIETATIDNFISILSEEPASLDGYLHRAKSYLSAGFFDQALIDAEYVIELEPKSFKAYEAKAIILYSQGAYDKSIRAFDNALHFAPNNSEIFYNRGKLYKSLGDNNNALFDFQMAFSINRSEKKYRKELRELGLIK